MQESLTFVKSNLKIKLVRDQCHYTEEDRGAAHIEVLRNGLVVKALDSQSRGPVFKTAGWLQGRLSLSSSRGR